MWTAQDIDIAEEEDWARLAQDIQQWLIGAQDMLSPEARDWGRDAFWMAFIGAHPLFPGGTLPQWDPRISMEGSFMEKYVAGGFASKFSDATILRERLWETLLAHVVAADAIASHP